MTGIFFQWLPLLIGWFALNIEEVMYIAITTGYGDIKNNLAAFTLAYAIVLLCESFLYPVLSGSNVYSKNKEDSEEFFSFAIKMTLVFFAVIVVCSLPFVSRFIFMDLMRLDHTITALTSKALLIMCITPILVGYRRFFQGILIKYGKSKFVTISSISRLITILLTSWIISMFINEGALIVSAAMVCGMAVDVIVTRTACQPVLGIIPNDERSPDQDRHFLSFYLPLGLSSMVIYLTFPLISFFASFGASALESIAVLAPVLAITFLQKSLGVSYQEIVVSRWNDSEQSNLDLRKVMYLITCASLALSLAFSFSPLARFYLINISGLSADLADFSILPLQLLFLLPAITVAISFLKGIYIRNKESKVIFISSLVETSSLAAVLTIGIFLSRYPAINKMAIATVFSNISVLLYLLYTAKTKPFKS